LSVIRKSLASPPSEFVAVSAPLYQPTKTSCGQTVVAMITGRPFEEIFALMGRRRTRPADLRKALLHYGWILEPRSKYKLPARPQEPAVLLRKEIVEWTTWRHWVLWTGKVGGWEIWDPAAGSRRKPYPGNFCGRYYRYTRLTPHNE
jgi:hypothetical protein